MYPTQVVALGNRRAHLARLITRANPYVEKPRVKAYADFSWMSRIDVIAGLGLIEVTKRGRLMPNIFIEPAIDCWRFCKSRRPYFTFLFT